jgi:CRP-like cAMP-binding protein
MPNDRRVLTVVTMHPTLVASIARDNVRNLRQQAAARRLTRSAAREQREQRRNQLAGFTARKES